MPATKQGAARLAAPPPTPDMDNGTAAHADEAPLAGAAENAVDQMFAKFMAVMEHREQALLAKVDEKLSRIESLRGAAPTPSAMPAATAPDGGLIPPPTAQGSRQIPRARRLVAFIPREDALNPRQGMFEGFQNGERLRIRRGQVGMVSRGTGIDWAKNHHGHVVDIEAMQTMTNPPPIEVDEYPSFARPDDWDGLPLESRSSFSPPRL